MYTCQTHDNWYYTLCCDFENSVNYKCLWKYYGKNVDTFLD